MYKKGMGFFVLLQALVLSGLLCMNGISDLHAAAEPAFQMKLDASYVADDKSSKIGLPSLAASNQRIVTYGVLEEPAEAQAEDSAEAKAFPEEGEQIFPEEGEQIFPEEEEQAFPEEEEQAFPEEEEQIFAEEEEQIFTEEEEQAFPEEYEQAWQSEDLVYQLEKEEYDLLLKIVEAEAGSEDEDGRLMVANVVFNRVNSDEFPNTVSEVVLQQSHGKAQFSPVSSGRIWEVKITEETIAAVQRALEGEDLSQGALYFAARRYADSESMRWFDEELTFLFCHGGHEFFS